MVWIRLFQSEGAFIRDLFQETHTPGNREQWEERCELLRLRR
jgi:hypothetical protein